MASRMELLPALRYSERTVSLGSLSPGCSFSSKINEIMSSDISVEDFFLLVMKSSYDFLHFFGFILLINYNNGYKRECQNVKMYKKVDNNLDKIPVLHFLQNKYMLNTSDELRRTIFILKQKDSRNVRNGFIRMTFKKISKKL